MVSIYTKKFSEFHGKLTACVNGVPEDIVLYDSKAADCVTTLDDGGHLQLSRRVLAVTIDEKVSFKIVCDDDARVMDYYPRLSGHSTGDMRLGPYFLEFKLVWSALYSQDVDGMPRCLAFEYVS